jgi:hypothetical protein
MKKLLLASLLFATPSFAQDVQFNLTVNNAEVVLIGKGLGSLPYNEVAQLMNKLQIQINHQQKPVTPPVAPVEPKSEDKP